MRIPAFNSAIGQYNKYNKTVAQNKNNTTVTPQNYTSIYASGNSAFVSFAGTHSLKQGIFSLDCTEKTGITSRVNDHVEYDKKTGAFTHQETDKNGKIISKYSYNPKTQEEEQFFYDNNGKATTIITTPSEQYTEKRNEGGQKYYTLIKKASGEFEEQVFEYNIGRKIVKSGDKYSSKTEVFDLKTGKPVTEGKLLLKKYKKGNVVYTINLITGQKLNESILDSKGDTIEYKEYSPKTGSVLYHNYRLRDGIHDIYYYDDALHTIKSEKITSNRGLYEKINNYDKFGNVTDSTAYEYYNSGEIKERTEFYTDDLNQIKNIEIHNEQNIEIQHFNKYKSYPYKIECFDENAFLYREVSLNESSGLPQKSVDYAEDGGYAVTGYKNGKQRQTDYYNKSKFNYKTVVYSASTGEVSEEYITDFYTRNKTYIQYSKTGDYKVFESVTREDGTKISEKRYYEDSDNVYSERTYFSDGSYIETIYDEYGNVESTKRHEKTKSHRTNFHYDSDFDFDSIFGTHSDKPSQKSDLEFLEEVNSKISSKHSEELAEEDWKRLADMVGIKDYRLLKGDKKTVFELVKKYHSDIREGQEITSQERERMDAIHLVLTSILNFIIRDKK